MVGYFGSGAFRVKRWTIWIQQGYSPQTQTRFWQRTCVVIFAIRKGYIMRRASSSNGDFPMLLMFVLTRRCASCLLEPIRCMPRLEVLSILSVLKSHILHRAPACDSRQARVMFITILAYYTTPEYTHDRGTGPSPMSREQVRSSYRMYSRFAQNEDGAAA